MLHLHRRRRNTADPHRLACWRTPLTLRLASDRDDAALRRLAERDSRSLPPGPLLIAVRAGGIDAAISMRTGELIADPFRPTSELAATLRFHARNARIVPDAVAFSPRDERVAGARGCASTVPTRPATA